MKDQRSTAVRQRHVRQEALRQQLEAGGHIQHVLDLAGELADQEKEMDQLQVTRYKTVIDTKLKLINKFLPDLKHVEVEANPVQAATDDELDTIIGQLRERVNEGAKATTH